MSNRRFRFRILVPVIAIVVVGGWLALREPGESHTADQPTPAASSSGHSPLGIKTVTQHFAPRHCSGPCPEVGIKTLRFANAPKLSTRLRQRLLGMARIEGDRSTKPPVDFHAYADKLFQENNANHQKNPEAAPYSAQFKARVVSRHDGLLIVRLNTYTFLGGAHGMPVTRYMVIDEGHKRVLSLKDMLRPGQHQAFEVRLRAAHARWAEKQSVDPSNWPFTPSDNVAPMPDGMAVTYQVYSIGPYAIGQPTLHLPYDQLRAILKPRFLPDGDKS